MASPKVILMHTQFSIYYTQAHLTILHSNKLFQVQSAEHYKIPILLANSYSPPPPPLTGTYKKANHKREGGDLNRAEQWPNMADKCGTF
jgi:hypothetical protein